MLVVIEERKILFKYMCIEKYIIYLKKIPANHKLNNEEGGSGKIDCMLCLFFFFGIKILGRGGRNQSNSKFKKIYFSPITM